MEKATMLKHISQQQFNDKVDIGSYYGSAMEKTQLSLQAIAIGGVRGSVNQFMIYIDDNIGHSKGATPTSQMIP